MANPAVTAARQEPVAIPDIIEQTDEANAEETRASTKFTKAEVSYRSAGKSQTRCVFCANYQPSYGTNSCIKVEGPINPGDVCDLYTPANASPGPETRGGSITDLVGPTGSE